MTPSTQPVRAWQVLLALAATVLGVVAVVIGLRVLVRPGDIEPSLAGPVAPVSGTPCQRVIAASPDTKAVKASHLIECPQLFDGRRVTYRGEIVRAVLRRDDRAWVQVNDDPYAAIGPLPEHRTAVGGNSGIPVSIPAAVADQVRHVGNHQHQGDLIQVTGVFHRTDPADGGGPTIQAVTATIEQPGHPFDDPTTPGRAVAAGIIALAALTLAALSRTTADGQ